MDNIGAIEEKITTEIVELQKDEAANQARRALRMSHLDQLRELFGRLVGLALSKSLGEIRVNGLEVVKTTRPISTLTKQKGNSREAGPIALCRQF